MVLIHLLTCPLSQDRLIAAIPALLLMHLLRVVVVVILAVIMSIVASTTGISLLMLNAGR